MQEEAEKRRVLEDALHVLAREHFVLEQSIRSQNKLVSSFHEVVYNDDQTFASLIFFPLFLEETFEGVLRKYQVTNQWFL